MNQDPRILVERSRSGASKRRRSLARAQKESTHKNKQEEDTFSVDLAAAHGRITATANPPTVSLPDQQRLRRHPASRLSRRATCNQHTRQDDDSGSLLCCCSVFGAPEETHSNTQNLRYKYTDRQSVVFMLRQHPNPSGIRNLNTN